MKLLRIFCMVLLAVTLAGCVKNEAEFEAFRIALKKRPDIQTEGLADCTRRIKYSHIEMKRDIANFGRMGLDDKLPGTFCRRLLNGYLSGRMKWADYKAIMSGSRQRMTPNLVRIIRGG